MRKYITISLDCEEGDASLTPESEALVAEMASRGDLMDCDQLDDILRIFENAYEQAMVRFVSKAAH